MSLGTPSLVMLGLTYRFDFFLNISYVERLAIKKALGFGLLLREKTILLLTDSQSILISIQRSYDSKYRNHHIIFEILELIKFHLKMGKDIQFGFLKVHRNICEKLDVLARHVISLTEHLLLHITKILFQVLEKNLIKMEEELRSLN